MPKLLSARFIKFLIVGGCCTALDFVLFALFYYSIGIPLVLANILSYGTGLSAAFFINRVWTFNDSEKKEGKRLWLSLIYGYVGLMLNTWLVWVYATIMHPMLAKIIAVVVVLIYNYATNKYLVFRVR